MSADSNGLDLERLTADDKAELRQFLAHEQQRSQIQSQTHSLTDLCWKRCIPPGSKRAMLEGAEQTCLANCVDRFLDMNLITMKHLNSMRQA